MKRYNTSKRPPRPVEMGEKICWTILQRYRSKDKKPCDNNTDSDENSFYADNVKYWTGYSDNGYTGEIENAIFPDTFKTTFMNYIQLDDGGIAQIKGEQNKPVYFMFEGTGDGGNRRMIVYNVSLGQINREYATTEDSIEPQTATLPFTANGDNTTGIVQVSYTETDATYSTMFTTPPVPTLPAGS